MNIDNYLSLLLVEGYSKNKSINPYQEICEYSVLYFKYLSDEDKKDYIKIFGFHPLQLKKWISKSNINNYRNLDYFIFVIVLQYLLLKSVLEIYKSGKIEETMDKFEKVLTNKISNNEVKENIKNMFKNNKQSNQSNQQQQSPPSSSQQSPPSSSQQQSSQQYNQSNQQQQSSQQSPPSSQQQSSQQYNQSNQQQQSSQQSNQSNQQQQSPSSSSQQQSSQQYNQSNQQQPPQQQQSNQQQQNQQQSNQQQSNQQQQNQQEEAERQRKQQEKENLEKQKEELQKEKENLENTINLEEDKKREIDVVNELLTTYIERLNNLNLEL